MATQDLLSKIINYWDQQPCNIKHSSKEVGTLEYFEEVKNKRYRAEPHIAKFADFAKWQGKRVLEIGCGIGTDAIEFAKAGANYTGIDISKESIKIAKQRFDCYNLDGTLLHMDASDLNLSGFDLVYSFGVIHHYPNIDRILANIHNSLVADGELRFMVYAKNSWKQSMINAGLDQYEAQNDCPYAQSYTNEEILNLLSAYNNIDITQDHCFMFQIQPYKRGVFILEPWFESMSDDMLTAIKTQLGWHLLVKATK